MAETQSSPESERLVRDTLAAMEKEADFAPAPAPVEELILETLREDAAEAEALEALGRIRKGFLDLNEMRVARTTEIARVLDPLTDAEDRARRIQAGLNRLFEREGGMSFGYLEELKPSEARKALQSLDKGIGRNTAGRILFATCPGATMPASAEALKAAKRRSLLGRSGTKAQLQKTLLQALEPEAAARLLFHLEAEGAGPARRRKSSTGSKTSAGRKTTTKKKTAGGSAGASRKKKKKTTSRKS
jgi:endonuclease III